MAAPRITLNGSRATDAREPAEVITTVILKGSAHEWEVSEFDGLTLMQDGSMGIGFCGTAEQLQGMVTRMLIALDDFKRVQGHVS